MTRPLRYRARRMQPKISGTRESATETLALQTMLAEDVFYFVEERRAALGWLIFDL